MFSRPAATLGYLAVLATLALSGCSDDNPTADTGASKGVACTYASDGQAPAKNVEPPPDHATVSGQVAATMRTGVGDIGLVLDADAAPCTVNSFVSLAEQGYFDKTSCHRLTTAEAGIFVLQCGDPTGTGMGGPGYTIKDEVSGDETYPAGTLAMAKTEQPDSGGSQFFIVYADTPLPPQYTVFGKVDATGLAVVRKVAKARSDSAYSPGSGHPNTPVDIEAVTVD